MNPKLNCIMLVDDDGPASFLSNTIIEDADCTKCPQIRDSGAKPVAYLLKGEQPGYYNNAHPGQELIFSDGNTPAMNGWEFLDNYKALEWPNKNKEFIIMLTTSLKPDDCIKGNHMQDVAGFEIKLLTTQLVN